MAKLTELKKYLGYEFSSGCYTGEDYKSFQTKYINYLKTICRDNHWQLVNVGRNHYRLYQECGKQMRVYIHFGCALLFKRVV